ncbi:MAG TPA: thiamine phosphate synthase [Kofleriaceae bacterium]|nr:thiamine phosphate synthase [Kofleriaceae bacterium]
MLITDRRLMGGVAGFGDAIARAVSGLAPGSAIVQVREKDLGGRELLVLVRAAIAAAPEQIVMVNDRLDVALAAAAGGVHLPEDGMDVVAVREAVGRVDGPTPCADAPAMIVGCSRHSAEGAVVAAETGADLVQLGPVWATPSKERYGAPIGTVPLTWARARMSTRCLVVAVGGVDSPARAAEARAAGADAVAVVRAVWTSPDPGAAALALT